MESSPNTQRETTVCLGALLKKKENRAQKINPWAPSTPNQRKGEAIIKKKKINYYGTFSLGVSAVGAESVGEI